MFKILALASLLFVSSVFGQPRTEVESPIIPTGNFPVVDWAFVGNKPVIPSMEYVDQLHALIRVLQAQIEALQPAPLYTGEVYLLAGELTADFSLTQTWNDGPTVSNTESRLTFPVVSGDNRQVKLAFATPASEGELFQITVQGSVTQEFRNDFLPLIGDTQQTVTIDGVLCNYYVMRRSIQALFGGHIVYTLRATRAP